MSGDKFLFVQQTNTSFAIAIKEGNQTGDLVEKSHTGTRGIVLVN